jgi:sialic acid synthase SpsE
MTKSCDIKGEKGDILMPYIIGETAYNHEGSINYLNRMVDDIAQLKLNAVKFHLLLNPNSYITKKHELFSKYKEWIFHPKEWEGIINRARQKKLDVIALCDDVESLRFINKKFGRIKAIELHATGINDYFLLEEASKFKGTVILGIGGSSLDEIKYAIDFLNNRGKSEILLMYGFQSYPTRYAEINLLKMSKIKNLFNYDVGYADHTSFDDPNNELISVMAAMGGFSILEKHYTPDKGVKRIDFQSAVGKDEMQRIKKLMSLALTVYGSGNINMSLAEIDYAKIGPMKKALVAKRGIKKDQKITLNNVWFKRTYESSAVKQNQILSFIGLKTTKNIKKDEIIDFSKVKFEFQKNTLESFGIVK